MKKKKIISLFIFAAIGVVIYLVSINYNKHVDRWCAFGFSAAVVMILYKIKYSKK